MLTTIGGNAPLASSGCTMDSPSFTLSCTWPMARAIAKHVVEDGFELWYDKNEQESHDRDGHGHHDERINHRGGDFVFDLGRFFLELGKPRQHELEHAADFARFDHVHVEIVKDQRVLRETFREGPASLDR